MTLKIEPRDDSDRGPIFVRPAVPTIWIAYSADWTRIAIFETEIETLRYACLRAMAVGMLVLPSKDARQDLLDVPVVDVP